MIIIQSGLFRYKNDGHAIMDKNAANVKEARGGTDEKQDE